MYASKRVCTNKARSPEHVICMTTMYDHVQTKHETSNM